MGILHCFIVVPYYFLGTLAVLPLLMVICRLLRVKPAINTLVGLAITITALGIALPLAFNLVDLDAFTARPMLVLIAVSFVFAGVDALLLTRLPSPLDEELREL